MHDYLIIYLVVLVMIHTRDSDISFDSWSATQLDLQSHCICHGPRVHLSRSCMQGVPDVLAHRGVFYSCISSEKNGMRRRCNRKVVLAMHDELLCVYIG